MKIARTDTPRNPETSLDALVDALIEAKLAELGLIVPPFVLTTDPQLEAKTGHTRRSMLDAIRRGDLQAAKATRGYRVDRADLEAWEAARREKRRRPPTLTVVRDDDRARDRALLANARRAS